MESSARLLQNSRQRRHRFTSTGYAYLSSTFEGYVGNIMIILDLREPAQARGSRTMVDARTVDRRRRATELGWRFTQVPSSSTSGNRLHCKLLAWGSRILDISEMSHPKFVSGFNSNPPYPSPIHTTLPIPSKFMDRDILVVADADAQKRAPLPPAFLCIVDITDETHPVPISTTFFRRARARTLNLKSVAISRLNRRTTIHSTSPGSAAVSAPWIFLTIQSQEVVTIPHPGRVKRQSQAMTFFATTTGCST